MDGRPWHSPEVAAEVVDIVGPGAKLVRYDGVERFDVLPLLVRTDGAVAAFGHRASTLTTQPLDRWRRGVGRARLAWLLPAHWPRLIDVQDLRLCCIMTSYGPGTLIQDKNITREIYRRFDGKLALNCFVIEGGFISVGDEVQLVRGRAALRRPRPGSSPSNPAMTEDDALTAEERSPSRAIILQKTSEQAGINPDFIPPIWLDGPLGCAHQVRFFEIFLSGHISLRSSFARIFASGSSTACNVGLRHYAAAILSSMGLEPDLEFLTSRNLP